MKPESEGWGTDWPSNVTPEKYVVALQACCRVTNVKYEKVYSRIQQSKEMLHQAALSYNQAIPTKLDNNLSIWKSTHINKTLPEEWYIEGHVDKFTDYKHIIMSAGPVGSTPLINQLTNKNNKNDWSQFNKGTQKFEMLLIQRPCCKYGGHQFEKKACRIDAQQYHIVYYAEKHAEEYKEKTKRYETMNRLKVIKKVCADNLLLSNIDHFLDILKDQRSLFHSDYSNEE